MKITLHKYIFKEIWPTFFTCLVVFVFIVLAARMMNILEWVLNRGVNPVLVLKMILYLLPRILLFALPAASLMAVFLAFLRLSGDNEILAIKSSGISLYQMLPPVLVLSLVVFLVAVFMGVLGAPWGNRSFKDLVFKIAQSKADLGLKERVFCEPFDKITFYINSLSPKDGMMKDIFLVDRREKSATNTIVARKGRILLHPAARIITIRFREGTIFSVGEGFDAVRTIGFDTYNINIGLDDIMASISSRERSPDEMFVGELLGRMRKMSKGGTDYNEMVIALMEKLAIPLAAFLMGIIGAPLGAQIQARGRFLGIIISLIIFFLYYICLAGVRSIGESGTLPPQLGPWIPVAFLLFSCGYLLHRAANERPFAVLERITLRITQVAGDR
ncbi:MAG: LPS export ABC transporter permease LptF [Deltaproteobacteria bacterium]|nr:LPS export ABC transporter permease LptF [Deltaproteobacteria bacterium]MBW2138106.1 LPS export ABC transporter permease LptF [Deltaproteobacteria bacterium]